MAEKLEDLNLPIAVIARLIKDALPEGTIVSKEARSAIAKAASVFVLYLTSTSNNVAARTKRKTINGDDVFQALADTEFEMFEEPLREILEEFKKSQRMKKDKKKQSKESKKTQDEDVTIEEEEEEEDKEEKDSEETE